jgi:hypothetical protein
MSDIPRDEKGHFLKGAGTPWTPEQLSEMGKRGNAALRAKRSAEAIQSLRDRANTLLVDLGIPKGWEGATEDLRILAESAVKDESGKNQAMRTLLQQTGNLVKSEKNDSPGQTWKPESGDQCPLCGGNRVSLLLDEDSLFYIGDIVRDKAPVEAGPTFPLES